jgi:hypothetical protein
MSFLDDYEPVAARLEKFWADHPDGRVETEIVGTDPVLVFRAAVYREIDEPPAATGFAHQQVLDVPPGGNKFAPEWTSPYEVCETSAIGRALANAGYATKERRPSREEMAQAQRRATDEVPEGFTSTAGFVDTVDRLKARVAELDDEATAAFTTWRDEQELSWPWSKATCEAIAAKLDEIAGPSVTASPAGEGAATHRASPSPTTDPEALAAQPCELCGSKRAKRVLTASGGVRCANTHDCEARQADDERPF